MFVVKIKDIVKYLVSIILLITIIILSARFFLNIFRENKIKTKNLSKNALTRDTISCYAKHTVKRRKRRKRRR